MSARPCVPLKLDRFIPLKDVRKLIWRHLTPLDREMCRLAQNQRRKLDYFDLDECIMSGYLNLLQWLSTIEELSDDCYMFAVEYGQLSILEWLCKRYGYPAKNGPRLCGRAARFGHLHILQWARSVNIQWDDRVCSSAASGGHLHILQWARANNCPWNEDTCTEAVQEGYVHIFEWAKNNGAPLDDWLVTWDTE
jgi:hypothetical protein